MIFLRQGQGKSTYTFSAERLPLSAPLPACWLYTESGTLRKTYTLTYPDPLRQHVLQKSSNVFTDKSCSSQYNPFIKGFLSKPINIGSLFKEIVGELIQGRQEQGIKQISVVRSNAHIFVPPSANRICSRMTFCSWVLLVPLMLYLFSYPLPPIKVDAMQGLPVMQKQQVLKTPPLSIIVLTAR